MRSALAQLAAALGAALVLAASPLAHAQTTTGSGGIGPVGSGNVIVDRVERSHADHEVGFEFYVSQDDCLSSDEFEFPLTLSNLSGVITLEVWIGEGSANCAALGSRNGTGGTAQCTRIYENGAPEQYMEIGISSREIAEVGLGLDGCVDDGASSEPRTVGIYFMLIRDPAIDVPSTDYAKWDQTKVDLLGPAPPTNVEATAGDGAAELEYRVPTNATDTLGFRFYCDDGSFVATESAAASGAGGAGGAGDGGATAATGAGGGGGLGTGGGGGPPVFTTASGAAGAGGLGLGGAGGRAAGTGACANTVMVAGQPPNPAWRSCGSARGVTGKGTANGLENGRPYAIAVAAFDDLDNVGVLSEIVCVEPFPVDDFYELYRQAGGQAGGGFCACSLPGAARGGGVAALITSGLGALALARRRRGRRARGGGR